MDLKLVKKLLNLISESEVDEVSIEEGDFKISVKKKSESEGPSSIHYQLPPQGHLQAMAQELPPQAVPSSTSPPPTSGNSETETGEQKKEMTAEGEKLRSPIVGTFYRSASPDSDPFVEVGDRIEKGDTICIVEAMKIMNEIEAEFSGIVQEILVENSQPVEYNQPLFIIKKD